MYARVGEPQRLPIKKGQLPMAAKVTTTSHLLYHLHPRNWVYSRERRNVRLISKGTRVQKKSDHTKCCARPARNGCSSETRRDILSVTGRNINNDAPAQCEALSLRGRSLSRIDKSKFIYSPSSRVATAERKLKLVNDASAKSFSATIVRCALCDVTITLDGEGDYNLTKWEEHKTICPRSVRFASP
jgi:hypothetical protein